ncbi:MULTISPECIES: tetratricopeptide repeat protein [unclassified Pseudomonas]|uniref:tetratricopeptide repeat protein n=1 Tax=unclassified Pseudomonas TaxID=196821 RepID=UPI0021C9569C|nr:MULTISPECIES: tetratricopeptide repeat protein [unclassified Pseudomonas]MCU1731796.1 tetratricopeptide repeat protein [Pseudomonas sp. 20P_3.2_Bac4]MCU1743078.1 tetratricopeptide repeat protein [Pseudomonas sp. 20P_3.2_Bac5]
MSRPRVYLLAGLVVLLLLALAGLFLRNDPPAPTPALQQSYAKALAQAHNGLPGAARVLYQQLGRDDLSPIRRASLYAELPNYPSPLALKLARKDLQHKDPLVRRAAVESIAALVPAAQRSLVLGPMLDDEEESVRFAAVDALLGLTPDEVGLYFGPLQEVLEQYQQDLLLRTEYPQDQVHLARLYIHERDLQAANAALDRALALEPDNLDAIAAKVRLLDSQGQGDTSREVLASALQRHPESAFLQHELGLWLLRHSQNEYALLAFSRALELEPDNNDYRYTLATSLHSLDQLDAAQKQLETVLSRQPANRKARVLLIEYWKESGQLQNVQVLLAQLEQQNPDDPLVQQGL